MNSQGKNFWSIDQYVPTPETGVGGRHYYLAKEFQDKVARCI